MDIRPVWSHRIYLAEGGGQIAFSSLVFSPSTGEITTVISIYPSFGKGRGRLFRIVTDETGRKVRRYAGPLYSKSLDSALKDPGLPSRAAAIARDIPISKYTFPGNVGNALIKALDRKAQEG